MKTEDFKKIDIKTRQFVDSLFLGNYKTAFQGRGLEFSEFREYDPSDDARHIDWLVSEREGTTLVRRYTEERDLQVLFILDLSASMFFGATTPKIEILQEIFYILGLSALSNGDKVWAYILDGGEMHFVPFSSHKYILFQILSRCENVSGEDSRESLDLSFLSSSKIKNTLTFVISDKLDIDHQSLKIAKLKNDIVYIHVSDSFEDTLEWTWIKIFSNGSHEIAIDLDNTKKKEKYIQERNQKKQEFQSLLESYKIDCLWLNEKINPYSAILQLMKKRESLWNR